MGGRVSDIAIDPRNPAVFYVGLGTGGVFKTSNNGVTFDPIFDKQPVLSIGAVAIAPSDSDVVWVGTGEANDRNSSEWGDGVYRSTDGGGTWMNVGLKESRAIARIVVHPTKPEVAYVAAMGNLWKDGGERGLYKTTDAGKTWKLVLQRLRLTTPGPAVAMSRSIRRIPRSFTRRFTRGNARRGRLPMA